MRMLDRYPIFIDEERQAFVAKRVKPDAKFKDIIFTLEELVQFFGIGLAMKLQDNFGGHRFRLVEKDIRAKIPLRCYQEIPFKPSNKSDQKGKRRGRLIEIGRIHFEEVFGRDATQLIFKYLKGVCIYVPTGSLRGRIDLNVLIGKVTTMKEEKKSNKEIAFEMNRSPSWVTWFIKKYHIREDLEE